MAELLSREKEFLKLNERLDKLAVSGLTDKPPVKTDLRYGTYTKNKGPSTLLKKRGAGDCFVPLTGDTSHRLSSRYSGKSSTVSRSNGVTSPPSDSSRKLSYVSTTSQRKAIKADSSTKTFSRSSHNRVVAHRTEPITVQYRNPKFVESPSLEKLIHEESVNIGDKLVPHTSNLESVVSLDTTGSVRSHGSNSKKQISRDGLIKFLNSKISILEEEHDRISHEMNEQKDLLEKTLERYKKIEGQRDQAYAKHNTITDHLKKLETQLEEANRTIKERSGDQLSQQKEFEATKRELKVLKQANSNLEKRLYRTNEELENTKKTCTQIKNGERELKETLAAQNDLKNKQIKTLRQQRAELLNAYKKQLYLIDNLKRQNTCVEQSKLLTITEKEFTKVLDWKDKS